MAPKGSTEGLGGRLTSLAAGCCDCPCTSLGYYGTPILVHRQEPPGLGHTRCRALLDQAQNSARAHAAWVTLHLFLRPPRPPRAARVECGIVGRGARDVGGVRGAERCRHASHRGRFVWLGKAKRPPLLSL